MKSYIKLFIQVIILLIAWLGSILGGIYLGFEAESWIIGLLSLSFICTSGLWIFLRITFSKL